MNVQQSELYQRIQVFSLDVAGASLPFSQRLAKENNWSVEYTTRAIEEYKKFAFLAVVAGHPVSPSDQVDQVWHLHLTYTQSYWEEFCPHVLGMPLHHGPTQGGVQEQRKISDWYVKTLASYQSFFGYPAPADIWPSADLRFSRDIEFVRVNRQQHWILPKPQLPSARSLVSRQVVLLGLLTVSVLTIIGWAKTALAASLSPLELRGPEFLLFYVMVGIPAILVALGLRWYLQQPARGTVLSFDELHAYETAYLAGGASRAINAAITNLVQQGYLEPASNQSRSLTIVKDCLDCTHPLERAIGQAVQVDGEISAVRLSVVDATRAIREQLQKLGLLVTDAQADRAKWLPSLVVLSVLLLGLSKIAVGLSRGRPVGILVVLCLMVGAIAIFWTGTRPHRSRYGNQVLEKLQQRYSNLRANVAANYSAEKAAELTLAVALFDVVILANTPLTNLQRLLVPPVSRGSGCSTSSGCSSGGCSTSSGCGGSSGCSGGSGCGSSCGGGCGGCGS